MAVARTEIWHPQPHALGWFGDKLGLGLGSGSGAGWRGGSRLSYNHTRQESLWEGLEVQLNESLPKP